MMEYGDRKECKGRNRGCEIMRAGMERCSRDISGRERLVVAGAGRWQEREQCGWRG